MAFRQSFRYAAALLAVALPFSAVVAGSRKSNSTATQMSERQRAAHALNRLTFGPRPGDIHRVAAIGVDKWIDQQLSPQKIDDHAVEARLQPYRTLRMSTAELVENFPPPQMLKAVADGRQSMPRDAEKRAIYQAALERYEQKKANKADQANDPPPRMDDPDAQQMTDEEKAQRREARRTAQQKAAQLAALAPKERERQLMALNADERRRMWRALGPDERLQLTDGMSAEQKETLLALENPMLVVDGELMAAKLARAAYSERQLQEVMTDFWFNHFNVFIGKGADRYMITAYERDVIRPHAMGKFEDLLLATAKSPAMLWYLDNWQSVGPRSPVGLGMRRGADRPMRMGRRGQMRFPRQRPAQQQQQQEKAPRGLNENYAREVMELHTLGVNGGYTQQDVTELARVLTGWSLKEPRRGGGFEFRERMHEPGTKVVLGQTFKDHGEREGEEALKMLAHQPSTAKFISKKLAMRFVSDDPPQALIDRMAQTFQHTNGDIKEVLRTMFKSPEFWAPESYRAKVKTPLEFVVSAVRATGADIEHPQALIAALQKMGQPLYGAQPPTGYSMKADEWVSSSALLNRMNFALALAAGRLPGLRVNSADTPAASNAEQQLAAIERTLLDGDVSQQTHKAIEAKFADPSVTARALDDAPRPPNTAVLTGLILGSPEFQRH